MTLFCSDSEIEYTPEDIQLVFTNMYFYSNIVESIADDNIADHHRFRRFIEQVRNKFFFLSFLSLFFSQENSRQKLEANLSPLRRKRNVVSFWEGV